MSVCCHTSLRSLVELSAMNRAEHIALALDRVIKCKLQNSVSYFWHYFMSYFLNCSAWKPAIYDREQVKKYDGDSCRGSGWSGNQGATHRHYDCGNSSPNTAPTPSHWRHSRAGIAGGVVESAAIRRPGRTPRRGWSPSSIIPGRLPRRTRASAGGVHRAAGR